MVLSGHNLQWAMAPKGQHAPHLPTHLIMIPSPLALVGLPTAKTPYSMSLQLIQWPLFIWPTAQASPMSPG